MEFIKFQFSSIQSTCCVIRRGRRKRNAFVWGGRVYSVKSFSICKRGRGDNEGTKWLRSHNYRHS
jgi:hypothetical protein